MPGSSGTRGHGSAGAKRGGGPKGSDIDAAPEGPGRSSASPGHRKKAAGLQSARELAPGRVVEIGDGPEPGREPDEERAGR